MSSPFNRKKLKSYELCCKRSRTSPMIEPARFHSAMMCPSNGSWMTAPVSLMIGTWMIPSCSTNGMIENCSRPVQMVNSTPGTRAVLNSVIVSSVMSEQLSSSVPSRSQAMSFWIAATALRAVDHAALADRGRDMKIRCQDDNVRDSSRSDDASIGHTDGTGRVLTCGAECTRKVKAAYADHVADGPIQRQNGTCKAPTSEPY